MKLDDLPDYPSLTKFASALWQQENAYHGAAIMIGAGFSRTAAVRGDKNCRLPLWNDLSRILAKELGTEKVTDPLRLAEEYCAYFGRQSLQDLVKKEINDQTWNPGELHRSLLELPWTEVLTTNWDTLLERASIEVHKPVYSVVSRQEELSNARSPRIVKLHGSINVTEDIVFTQEDYRKYRHRNAAFVNFARQVFIENELCLLGFSGDDPNFIQWAGWVRDQLATHIRRIYLVGALTLTAPQRKYLESINIAPIDLEEMVADYDDPEAKHFEAARLFIQALNALKPKQIWEWEPTPLHRSSKSGEELEWSDENCKNDAKRLEQQIPTLQRDRLSYPGWLVCPDLQRWSLRNQICDPFPTAHLLSELEFNSKAKLLYEMVWRCSISYGISYPWLVNELLQICDSAKQSVLSKKQQVEVALFLLKSSRWLSPPESNSTEKKAIEFLEANIHFSHQGANELIYHKAIVARDRFDFKGLNLHAENITTDDPEWMLRKASIFAELGRFEEGRKLAEDAYQQLLSQHRVDQGSIYVFSRLAWAHWLVRGIGIANFEKRYPFPSIYKDRRCDPFAHIQALEGKISKALETQRKKQVIEPSFEPGRYKDHMNSISFSNEIHPLLQLEGMANSAGVPLRWGNLGLLVSEACRISELDDIQANHRFSLAIRSASSDDSEVLKRVFGRTRIACMKKDEVSYLISSCLEAIDYWMPRCRRQSNDRFYAFERMRVFTEVLARISVRATPEQASTIFHLGCAIGKEADLRHFWLFEALDHLLKYSLKSVPENEQSVLLVEAMLFPLHDEIIIGSGKADINRWPNPVITFPGKRGVNTVIDRRIDEMIDLIAPCSQRSAPVLSRLLELHRTDFLTSAEREKISLKLWGGVSDSTALPETGLYRFALLELPVIDYKSVMARVREYLFEADDKRLFTADLLTDVSSAAQADNIKVFPTESQALDYFLRLVAWRAPKEMESSFDYSIHEDREVSNLVGKVLAYSIAPSLSALNITEENFQKLYDFYVEEKSAEVVIALARFAALDLKFSDRVEKLIRQGLQDPNASISACSSFALLVWREQAESEATNRLTSGLIYLIGLNANAGLSALLWTASQMYKKGHLSLSNIELLTETLPTLFDYTNYANVSSVSRQSISVSLVRAGCVKLARDILSGQEKKDHELLRIIDEAKTDALPEVRFA